MIRHVRGSVNLVYVRRGLRIRYGYSTGTITVWGDWRWTRWGARRELMAVLEAVGL